jgi:hypothetical protein
MREQQPRESGLGEREEELGRQRRGKELEEEK